MKKSAIALAVAAALVGSSAFADTTLYGSARVSVDYNDLDTTYTDARAPNGALIPLVKGYTSWDVVNNSSRLGVRGEEDLGGGLSAIYQYEFGVDVTEGGNWNSNRPKWVGLKGASWGSVTLGTQWTPYYNVLGVADVFNDSNATFGTFQERTGYLGYVYGLRMDNSLMYSSPNWSGFGFQVMLVMNGDVGANEPTVPTDLVTLPGNKLPANLSSSVDMYQLNATYKNGPFFAGAAYMAVDGRNFDNYFNQPLFTGFKYTTPNWDGDQWGLAFGYNSGPFAVSLNYEDGDLNTLYFGGGTNVYLTGAYTFGNNIIRGAYGYTDPDKGQVAYYTDGVRTGTYTQDTINTFVLGYQYNFSKRTRVWAEYINSDADSDLIGTRQSLSIGTRVDF